MGEAHKEGPGARGKNIYDLLTRSTGAIAFVQPQSPFKSGAMAGTVRWWLVKKRRHCEL
jgi:hypothetical protein